MKASQSDIDFDYFCDITSRVVIKLNKKNNQEFDKGAISVIQWALRRNKIVEAATRRFDTIDKLI